jgi:hypothetical protein
MAQMRRSICVPRRKLFFFEKKNQKTSAPLRVGMARSAPQGGTQSFFCFFFVHKKEDSSFASGCFVWRNRLKNPQFPLG